jgi:hypothetical protein
MIHNSTSTLTASHQNTAVELVSWTIGVSTQKYVSRQNLQRNYPPLDIHPVIAQHVLLLNITPTTIKPPLLLNSGATLILHGKKSGNPMLFYSVYFMMKLNM